MGEKADLSRADTACPVRLRPSPNHGERRGGRAPTLLVLHYTGMTSGEAAEDWLAHPAAEVSCHYLVHESGEIVQMVPEARRAWHAGVGSWLGEGDVNSRSIGVEIHNPGHAHGYRRFPEAQVESVLALGLDIVGRHGIGPAGVVAHSDTAPGRKEDPGELFPWERLAAAGLGLWADPPPLADPRDAADTPESVRALQEALAAHGYGLAPTGTLDAETRLVLTAFQRHFRPARVDGIADRSTLEAIRRLGAARERSEPRLGRPGGR